MLGTNFSLNFFNRSVHACEQVDIEAFLATNLQFINILLDSQCEPLLTLTDEYHPQLVWMFYANIQIVRMGVEISLECQVKYTKFALSQYVLDRILGLRPAVQPHLSRKEYKNQCLADFANLCRTQTSFLSYLVLKCDPHLLYYVIVRTFFS